MENCITVPVRVHLLKSVGYPVVLPEPQRVHCRQARLQRDTSIQTRKTHEVKVC